MGAQWLIEDHCRTGCYRIERSISPGSAPVAAASLSARIRRAPSRHVLLHCRQRTRQSTISALPCGRTSGRRQSPSSCAGPRFSARRRSWPQPLRLQRRSAAGLARTAPRRRPPTVHPWQRATPPTGERWQAPLEAQGQTGRSGGTRGADKLAARTAPGLSGPGSRSARARSSGPEPGQPGPVLRAAAGPTRAWREGCRLPCRLRGRCGRSAASGPFLAFPAAAAAARCSSRQQQHPGLRVLHLIHLTCKVGTRRLERQRRPGRAPPAAGNNGKA